MIIKKQTLTKRVLVVHMRNDLSGSTRVLEHALQALRKSGFQIDLYTSTIDYDGFLSNIPEVAIHPLPYKRFPQPWKSFASYLYSQIWLFFTLLGQMGQPAILYVSTVLPFGASLAARLTGKRVIYHLHEISLAPAPILLKKWLFFIVKFTASKIIYVSHFLKDNKQFPNVESIVVHNSLSQTFLEKTLVRNKIHQCQGHILMVSSLASYKGVPAFIQLAKMLPQYNFVLVLNASQKEVQQVFGEDLGLKNLIVHTAQRDVHQFYQKASLVLNLSDPRKHIETFGMTLLEGMAYGLPCISPPIGGVLELVENNVNGFLIDSMELNLIAETIQRILETPSLYEEMSVQSLRKSKLFNPLAFQESIQKAFRD